MILTEQTNKYMNVPWIFQGPTWWDSCHKRAHIFIKKKIRYPTSAFVMGALLIYIVSHFCKRNKQTKTQDNVNFPAYPAIDMSNHNPSTRVIKLLEWTECLCILKGFRDELVIISLSFHILRKAIQMIVFWSVQKLVIFEVFEVLGGLGLPRASWEVFWAALG